MTLMQKAAKIVLSLSEHMGRYTFCYMSHYAYTHSMPLSYSCR